VIVFGGWGICRASIIGAPCSNNIGFLGYFVFFFLANLFAFMSIIFIFCVVVMIKNVFDYLYDATINISKELHNQNNVATDNQVSIQQDV
jgi:hypothetical protein